jgi:glucosamine-6-phosphate deaminase
VRNAVEGPVTNVVPASALQKHARTVLFLDSPAASLLSQETVRRASAGA